MGLLGDSLEVFSMYILLVSCTMPCPTQIVYLTRLDVIFIIGSHSYYHQHHIKHRAYSYHTPGSKCRLDEMFEKFKFIISFIQIREVILDPFFSNIPMMSSNSISSTLYTPKFCNNYILRAGWLSFCVSWHLPKCWPLIGLDQATLDSDWLLLSDEGSPLCHCDTIIISSHKIFSGPKLLPKVICPVQFFYTFQKRHFINLPFCTIFKSKSQNIFFWHP